MKAQWPKIWPNYGPGVSDTCHILVKKSYISHCLLCQWQPSTGVHPTWIYTDFLSSTVTGSPVTPSASGRTAPARRIAVATRRCCDLLHHPPVLRPSHRGLSWITSLGTFRFKFISFISVICRAFSLCQALFQALIRRNSLIPYSSLPYSVGTTVISVLQVRSLDSGEAE